MGFYIGVPEKHHKATQLAQLYGACVMDAPPATFEAVPEGLALICVVDNGPFEAAALCHSAEEFAVFNSPTETRPRTWLLLDQAKAHELAGYTG